MQRSILDQKQLFGVLEQLHFSGCRIGVDWGTLVLGQSGGEGTLGAWSTLLPLEP